VWAQDCCLAQNQGWKLSNQIQIAKDSSFTLLLCWTLYFIVVNGKVQRERGAL
jgi:hypothetical protein